MTMTVNDPCVTCGTSEKEFKVFPYSKKAAEMHGSVIYAEYTICPTCESLYYEYSNDDTIYGHQRRYDVGEKERQELLTKVHYKFWRHVHTPKTEYGVYRKHGKEKLHHPFKGDVYNLIESAFQHRRQKDIEKLATIYPKEVAMVRAFDV